MTYYTLDDALLPKQDTLNDISENIAVPEERDILLQEIDILAHAHDNEPLQYMESL